MSDEPFVSANRAVSDSDQANSEAPLPVEAAWPSASEGRHRFFWSTWYFVNALLPVSIFAAVYATAWEYSTRRYLKGFSDAIIPAAASASRWPGCLRFFGALAALHDSQQMKFGKGHNAPNKNWELIPIKITQ
jgi:hypothetical protein